jgi:hypothetical protein
VDVMFVLTTLSVIDRSAPDFYERLSMFGVATRPEKFLRCLAVVVTFEAPAIVGGGVES